jgi:SAM-dependent methyltransferase
VDERLFSHFYDVEQRFWWNVGTRRAFWSALAGVAPGRDARVMDVGCGTGIVLREFPWHTRLRCGIDASSLALSLTRRRGLRDLARADVRKLPIASDTIDVALALDVIEHLDDDAGALVEIARALRPGGHLLLHVPAFNLLWSGKDRMNHHRRRYRRPALRRLVRAAGLEPVRVAYLNMSLFPPALARAVWHRLRPPEPRQSEAFLDRLYHPSGVVNGAMTVLVTAEARIADWLPFGLSLLCLGRKLGST